MNENGAVIDGLEVFGCIRVRANNVTIRNTRVHGPGCDNRNLISVGYGTYSGLLIEDVEIDGHNRDSFGAAIGAAGYTCRRCNIHGVGQGANMTGDVVVEDSYIHDIYYADGSHNEALISGGGSNIVVRGNNLEGTPTPGTSSTISLYGDFSQIRDVLVENNLFNGGGYCVYAGSVSSKPYPVAENTRFLNNVFGSKFDATCGWYGPVTAYQSGNGNAWSGNVWQDSGLPVNP